MSRDFELHKEMELDASPEQVWEAIATGPGISSWFMGPHEVEPHVGGPSMRSSTSWRAAPVVAPCSVSCTAAS
jgi:uncharacterized protein YndB with AHSA1/START domain